MYYFPHIYHYGNRHRKKFSTFIKVELKFIIGQANSSVLIVLSYSNFYIGDWFIEIISINYAN